MTTEIIYSEDAVFPYDREKDHADFEHYADISLLTSVLPTIGSVKLTTGKRYRITIELVEE